MHFGFDVGRKPSDPTMSKRSGDGSSDGHAAFQSWAKETERREGRERDDDGARAAGAHHEAAYTRGASAVIRRHAHGPSVLSKH